MQESYTTLELATVLALHVSSVRRRATAEAWQCIQRPERLGGNSYPYATLPEVVKAAIAKKVDAREAKPVDDGRIIPDWAYRIGLARYQVVADWRDYCKKQAGKKVKKSAATEAFLSAFNTGLIAKDAFDSVGEISAPTLYRWDKTLRDHGDDFHVLCDGRGDWRKDKPRGQGQISPEAAEAFLAAWLTANRPSVSLAYTCMETALNRAGLSVPSEATVYRFSRRFEADHHDLVVLKREGEKALNDKVLPWIKRNSNILEVGDCFFADGHTLNFECLHPETGKPFRPTLICWYDWKSGLPVGWEIMPTENSIAVASGYRMAVIHTGKMSRVAYVDNGKAFKNKYFQGTQPDFEIMNGLYARLGVALQFAKPYHGQSKVVERFFSTFNEQCARLMPSYTGASIMEKPAWRMRNEKYHKTLHDKQAFMPTLREAMDIFRAYVEWFADRPHPHIAGKTHGEVFNEGRGPGVDHTELDRHFLWTEKIRPVRCGFTLAGVRYESDVLYGVNRDIAIKFSWADLSEVYLYTLDGERLGVAKPQIEMHPLARHLGDGHDVAMVADANRRTASFKKSTMQEAKAADKRLTHQPGLRELAYVPKRIEPPQNVEAEAVYDLSEEERRQLESVYENAVSDMSLPPRIERQAWFQSEFEKYDWLFNARLEGLDLTADELAFMAVYEESSEYKNATGARYEQLKEAYGLKSKEQEVVQ